MRLRLVTPGTGPVPTASTVEYTNREYYRRLALEEWSIPPFPLPKPKAADIWRLMRPYGVWTCADGRQVLLNRDYIPLLERYPGQPVRPTKLNEFVEWIEQRWFYNDGTPRDQVKKIRDALLADWGLPPMPRKPSGYGNSNSHIYRRHWPNPFEMLLPALKTPTDSSE